MGTRHRLVGAGLAALFALAMPRPADAADALEGAWAPDLVTCEQAFVKRNGQLALSRSAVGWTAFIARGGRVQGANATCKLVSQRQKGDVLTLLLNCASRIMFEQMTISVRFLDDNRLVRFDPDFPEVETTYHRCDR